MEVFVIMIQSIFHLKSQRQRTLRLLFEDCRFIYFHSLMKSAFLPSKGLLCLYDKQNNIWLLVDMEFLFSCSTRHLTRSLRSLVSYRVKHSKRNSSNEENVSRLLVMEVVDFIFGSLRNKKEFPKLTKCS